MWLKNLGIDQKPKSGSKFTSDTKRPESALLHGNSRLPLFSG